GRHHQSLRHAQGALKLLNARCSHGLGCRLESQRSVLHSTTVAAMHSVGAQLEHLGRRREALTAYRRGLRFAVEHLPADAEVIEVLNVACDQLSKKRDLPLSGGNSLSISPRSSPVSDARKVEAFTDLRCPLKTVGEGTDSPTQQVVRGLGREHSTDLGSLPPFIFDAEARPSSRRVEEEELPSLVLVGEVGCKGEQPRVQNSPPCHLKLVLREDDVLEADRTIQRPVRRRQTAGEEQERREEELTQQRCRQPGGRSWHEDVEAPRRPTPEEPRSPRKFPHPRHLGKEGARPKKAFREGRPTPRDRRPQSRARLGGSRGQAAGIEGGDILGSASPVGEADEVSLAGLSSRSDALDADGPPAAVLLPLDEHLDDGELFFPRDVQDGYVSWAEPPSTRPMHHDKPPTADSLSSETVERILGSSSSETLRDDANDSSAFLTGVNLERERRGSQSHDQAPEPGALENKASVLASVPVAGPRGRRPVQFFVGMLFVHY
ncbi:hypothetical protein FOZ63_000866, partial [Perkinsus olseni]